MVGPDNPTTTAPDRGAVEDERPLVGLSRAQADGLACVVCGADYLSVRVPHVPVGRSVTGSQVFACVGECAVTARRMAGGEAR